MSQHGAGARSDRDEIIDLLTRLRRSRTLLSVNVGNNPHVYASLLLDVDVAADRLRMDALYPLDGHRLVVPGTRLSAAARLDGLEVRFDTTVTAIGGDAGHACYETPIPSSAVYTQRREAFRVPIPADLALPPSLFVDGTRTVPGRLLDISEHGVGALVPATLVLPEGETVGVFLDLGDARFGTVAEIRSVAAGNGRTRLGARFPSLPAAQRLALGRVMTQLQRGSIRGRRTGLERRR